MFGLVAGWLVIRTGGLEAGIAMHILDLFGIDTALVRRWQQPPDTSGIEIGVTETIASLCLEDDRRDQVSRDHEKDVDSGESTGQGAGIPINRSRANSS